MDGVILHSGFDGLRFTIQADIPPEFREELASAKAYAKESHGEAWLNLVPSR
ncbi:hypothetical protein [Aliiroseovarius subalbicans]|uniref:hypothetical protein n=1 Tax=Aliiroseovarius subalbicans TaxID=2925840 RepID=UPI001F5950C0|nr:hypothetical protein [Aliiroseovarius subalbicans]MCI2399289.1 hypothetical protein [Aliiroseovarius subalbicans]